MIRKSENKDIEAILSIWLSASIKAHDFIGASFWESQVESMRDIYLPSSEVYLYEQSGKVAGFYALHGNTLAAIFVEPDLQGKGFGCELLNHAKSKRNELILTVYKENENSYSFYKKNGFVLVKEQVDSRSGHIELLMKMAIK